MSYPVLCRARFWLATVVLVVSISGSSLGQEPLNQVLERELQAQAARFQAMEEEAQDEEAGEADVQVSDAEFYLPVDERMAADIDRMIGHLTSPDYAERQAAYDGLVQIGAPAMRYLRDEYARTDDLEAQLAIEQIVYRAYLDHHVYSRHAFLGISLQPYLAIRGDEDSPLNVSGVRIVNVIKDTAAERAGLLEDDVIIAADGEALTGRGRALVDGFSQSIASRQPGARMLLTVARPDGHIQVDVTLGRVPRDRVQQTSIRDRYLKVERRFNVWWNQYFVGDGLTRADSE